MNSPLQYTEGQFPQYFDFLPHLASTAHTLSFFQVFLNIKLSIICSVMSVVLLPHGKLLLHLNEDKGLYPSRHVFQTLLASIDLRSTKYSGLKSARIIIKNKK
jgi:hypothetical protein